MLKGLRPPTHRIDAPGVLILAHDDAWDHERLEAEFAESDAVALEAKRAEAREKFASAHGVRVDQLTDEQVAECDAACALTDEERDAAHAAHPYRRYLRGESRYQIDAPDQGPRGPVRVSEYLKPDAQPARFELRRIPWRERARIEVISDLFVRFEAYVRAGLAGVEAEDVRWRAEKPTDQVPEEILEVICESGGGPAINLIALSSACKRFSDPLTDAEGKR